MNMPYGSIGCPWTGAIFQRCNQILSVRGRPYGSRRYSRWRDVDDVGSRYELEVKPQSW